MRKCNDEVYQLAKDQATVSQHFVSPGHSLEDFGRSKIYIIHHNPSWKENQQDELWANAQLWANAHLWYPRSSVNRK